jgi:hypothetical protein
MLPCYISISFQEKPCQNLAMGAHAAAGDHGSSAWRPFDPVADDDLIPTMTTGWRMSEMTSWDAG